MSTTTTARRYPTMDAPTTDATYFLPYLHQITFVLASVVTSRGSLLILVARGGRATVVTPDGISHVGASFHVHPDGRLFLLNEAGMTVLKASRITRVDVHEN